MNISFERALENKQASSSHFCKALPKNQMVIIDKGKWEDIYSRRKIRKSKSVSLPTDWSSYFAEKVSLVNKYCCICFARHYLPRKGKNLLMADFYCKISVCKVSGKLRLHINMELHLEYNINFIKYKNSDGNFFQARFIKGTERGLLQEKLLDIKFPSKEFHKNLASLDKDRFNAGNLTGTGKSKEIYKQINHEGVKHLQHHDDIYLSIAKVKEKFTSEIVGQR